MPTWLGEYTTPNNASREALKTERIPPTRTQSNHGSFKVKAGSCTAVPVTIVYGHGVLHKNRRLSCSLKVLRYRIVEYS